MKLGDKMPGNSNNSWTLYDLEWDTDFFGIKSGKLVLNNPITFNEFVYLKEVMSEYEFVTITNLNSQPVNAQLIGRETTAFLADTNIQFFKKIDTIIEKPNNISFHKALEENENVLNLVNFPYSKFTEDPELEKRGGAQVYKKWVQNSFDKKNKNFALSKDINGEINGFLLYSISGNATVVELIAVSPNSAKGGIGTNLFKAVEFATQELRLKEIKVGTQMRNSGAINFYHKVGCRQVACHQVYHLWNLN